MQPGQDHPLRSRPALKVLSYINLPAQPLCFAVRMTEWLDQLPHIDAAIADAEYRIDRQRKLLQQLSRQDHSTSEAESGRSLELMLTLTAFLRDCRTAIIARVMDATDTRH